jgi:hypothetical protein
MIAVVQWAERFSEGQDALWDTLSGFDHASRMALFAHCASPNVNGRA